MSQEPIDKLWNYNDPATSEQRFRDRLATDKAAHCSIDDEMELVTQIARTLSLQRKFAEAHHELEVVKTNYEKLSPLVQVRYLLERGRTYNSTPDIPNARPLFLQAFELSQQHSLDYFTVDAAHMLGICEEPTKALEWNERAMKIAEASNDTRAKGWLGALYNNTGWTYYDMKEYDNALACFERDVLYRASIGKVAENRIARYSVAKIHRAMKHYDLALSMVLTLEKEIDDTKAEQDGYVYEEIGENLLALGKTSESKPYFTKAYDLLSKDIWLAANEKERLERLYTLSQ